MKASRGHCARAAPHRRDPARSSAFVSEPLMVLKIPQHMKYTSNETNVAPRSHSFTLWPRFLGVLVAACGAAPRP
jgi:hypothetical protein